MEGQGIIINNGSVLNKIRCGYARVMALRYLRCGEVVYGAFARRNM